MAPKTRPLWRQNSTPQPMPAAPLSTSLPTFSSSCSKLVSLSDWWLIKSETDVDGKRLAVGGYHCEEKTTHIFTSAPVVKTFDPYTVETADGSTLRLQGGINRSRMQQNGFPPEVSQCFFIGFPYNWEYYAKKDFGPIIPNSATFPTSSVINNEGIFPVPEAFEFPLVKLFNDCASNPESSVEDLLLKNLTSSPVIAESDKDPEFKTRKMSPALEASFESPQACAQRNTDTESYSISVDKFCSSLSSPFASSMLRQIMKKKQCGSELNLHSHSKRVKVNPPNDDSDVPGSTFNENTDILPLSGKESTENDTKTSSADASPVRKDNSDCYMLRTCDAKMDINSLNCEKKSKLTVQSPNISEEIKSPLTHGKMRKQKVTLSTSPELLNPKRSRSGRLLLPPINRWQREIVYDMDGSITNIADVDKLTSVTGGTSKQSRRTK